MKKIVIIAGGGVFGYMPAYFLAHSDEAVELYEKIDAIGGTSVGGILSLTYASGMNSPSVHETFTKLVSSAFSDKWYSKFKFWGPRYDGKNLNKALVQAFGDTRLKDLKLPVVIPSLDFENNKPKVWDNFDGNVDGWENVWEVARMTASAPTYFPPWKGHIDGALLANIPILETVSALKHKKGWQYRDMDVLVLGTGVKSLPRHPAKKVKRWGRLRWVLPLIDYLTYANEQTNTFIAKQMGLGKLTVFNPVPLKSEWDMDDAGLVPKLDEECSRFRPAFDAVMREFLG